MIEDKAKELNIKIKLNNIYKYSLIYIQIIRGSKSNRKKFKEWIEDNRPLKIKIEVKDTNLFKELCRGLISREFNSTLINLIILVSLINRDYVHSLISCVALIALSVEEIATSLKYRARR